jgi:two-component system cell cycle sensor histidine kinase/response regulator CckA
MIGRRSPAAGPGPSPTTHDREGRGCLPLPPVAITAPLLDRVPAHRPEDAGGRPGLADLARGCRHEFGNILYGILQYASLARAGLPPQSEAYECLEQIEAAGRRARDLVERLVVFAGALGRAAVPTFLPDLLAAAAAACRAESPSGLVCEVEADRDCGPVRARPGLLDLALAAILTNAREALAGRPGRIRIGLAETAIAAGDAGEGRDLAPGRYARLTVDDDGPGLEPGLRARVFEPFFTTRRACGGVGLGLALARWAVLETRGAIAAGGEPGRGATIVMHLPIDAAAAGTRPAAAMEPAGKGTSRKEEPR